MPLVIMCGMPCSGKTRRTQELVDYINANSDKQVHVVSDDFSVVAKNDCYVSSREEKMLRGNLKSRVERLLTADSIVVLDSLNYIKGFRYELFCVSKHVKTPHCVLLCDTPQEQAREWNSTREIGNSYSNAVLDALVMRFEPPDSLSRWDSPLFNVQPDDPLPTGSILDALLKRKAPPPNQSTQSQPLSATDFLHELDRRTQEVVTSVMEGQRSGLPGDDLSVPRATDKFHMARNVPMAELWRFRRQFITYTKLHPVENHDRISSLFVQYLNRSI